MLDTIYLYNEVDELWESYYTPEFRGGLVSDENNNIYFISVQAGASGPAYYDLILNQFDNGTVTQATLIAEDVPVPPRVINRSNKIIIKNGQFYVSVVTQSSNYPFLIIDRKSTRLNSSHVRISYAVFCLKKKKQLIHYFAL